MKYILFTVLSILVLGTSSCKKWQKKYPEDTEKSKLTPTERIKDKWWVLQSASLNGIDYTDSVYKQFGIYKMYLQDDVLDVFNYNEYYSGYVDPEKEPDFGAVWRFFDGDEWVGITSINGTGSNVVSIVPCYHRKTISTTRILKLSSNELKLSFSNANNDTIIINTFSAQ